MSEAGFSAAVTISINDAGGRAVHVAASEAVNFDAWTHGDDVRVRVVSFIDPVACECDGCGIEDFDED